MTAVDVLAVMDYRLGVMDAVYGGPGWEANQLREARAAVAELMEAAQEVCDNIIICETSVGKKTRAALARCKGEAK